MDTTTPVRGPEQPTSSRARLSRMGERMRMKAPKVPMMKGNGRGRNEIGEGHIQLVPAGHQVMAHFVGSQDQEQGEGKRDALIKQGRGRQGIYPLLDGPGYDGGDHRGQKQGQVQQRSWRAREVRGSRVPPNPSRFSGAAGGAGGEEKSILWGQLICTFIFNASISSRVSNRNSPRGRSPDAMVRKRCASVSRPDAPRAAGGASPGDSALPAP